MPYFHESFFFLLFKRKGFIKWKRNKKKKKKKELLTIVIIIKQFSISIKVHCSLHYLQWANLFKKHTTRTRELFYFFSINVIDSIHSQWIDFQAQRVAYCRCLLILSYRWGGWMSFFFKFLVIYDWGSIFFQRDINFKMFYCFPHIASMQLDIQIQVFPLYIRFFCFDKLMVRNIHEIDCTRWRKLYKIRHTSLDSFNFILYSIFRYCMVIGVL